MAPKAPVRARRTARDIGCSVNLSFLVYIYSPSAAAGFLSIGSGKNNLIANFTFFGIVQNYEKNYMWKAASFAGRPGGNACA
jgi:hypothetical protein